MSDVSEYTSKTLAGFTKKASHNKNESLTCIILILGSSALAPLFITLGSGLVLGKIIPSVLSVIAGVFTSWMQLRKPQKLWGMYREAQRLIEDQVTKHRFKIGDYNIDENADRLLAEKVAEIALNSHNEWIKVIPAPETLTHKDSKSNGR
jgi:hypothetical protein